jgi:50S ribosomal protein L16 3-hydroxylase
MSLARVTPTEFSSDAVPIPRSPSLLGGLSSTRFLRSHWQRKPLLVRGAFPAFVSPMTPEELAGLACEEDVESRLVLERGGRRPWQVVDGPQDARRLRRLPRTHWTLLVQGVDRLVPEVAALVEPFRFVPDWRIDDVMVSFASRFGSVGPHVDRYDVFLLQGLGRRRWDVDARARPELRPGLDLQILKRFRPQTSWVLEPGDMLYLPPGVAHHGVSLDPGMTFSIGFRAPSGRELLAAALRQPLLERPYRDAGRRPARSPAELPAADLRALRRLTLATARRLSGSGFERVVGELVTEPKEPGVEFASVHPDAVRTRLRSGASLTRRPGARLVFLRSGADVTLFAEGRSLPLPRSLAFAAPFLTGRPSFGKRDLEPYLRRPGFVDLLARLVSDGAFEIRPARRA